MHNNFQNPHLDQPAFYLIKVEGRLEAGWSQWFDGMTLTIAQEDQGQIVTTLSGVVCDQVALHGLLGRIRDLCLPLLLVQRVESDPSAGEAV